jgi:hypothetical protein
MDRVSRDLDTVAPAEFATFQQVDGTRGPLAPGDEYVVRMPGPWDGPVRVVAASTTSFRLATLRGHLEAGQIEFRVSSDYRSLWFEIESWARSGDRLSDLLYTHLRVSKEVQVHMWTSTIGRVIDLAGGQHSGGIVIVTRLVEPSGLPGHSAEGGIRSTDQAKLESLARRKVNFDHTKIDSYIKGGDWRVDDMVEVLPNEGSGPPVEGGSWEAAREMMVRYQLADPGVVSAIYAADEPLEGRNMLLRIRFAGLQIGRAHV